MEKIRNPIIDLFAGCGGLSLGLEQAGFTPVYVNEINNDPLNTYKNNRSHLSYLKNKKITDWWVSPQLAQTQNGLAEVVLSSAPRVERYAEKTLAKMHPSPLPFWKEYQWATQSEIDDKTNLNEKTTKK